MTYWFSAFVVECSCRWVLFELHCNYHDYGNCTAFEELRKEMSSDFDAVSNRSINQTNSFPIYHLHSIPPKPGYCDLIAVTAVRLLRTNCVNHVAAVDFAEQQVNRLRKLMFVALLSLIHYH